MPLDKVMVYAGSLGMAAGYHFMIKTRHTNFMLRHALHGYKGFISGCGFDNGFPPPTACPQLAAILQPHLCTWHIDHVHLLGFAGRWSQRHMRQSSQPISRGCLTAGKGEACFH